MNEDQSNFWALFIESQQLRADILFCARHPIRIRFWRLIHPLRAYRAKRARAIALYEAKQEIMQSAQAVIDAANNTYETALRFLESLEHPSTRSRSQRELPVWLL
jgi:hypothetical protein